MQFYDVSLCVNWFGGVGWGQAIYLRSCGLSEPHTTIPIEPDNEMNMMSDQHNPKALKDPNRKKTSGIPGKINPACETSLHTISDNSLSGFLNKEPDIYSDADLKISNPVTLVAIKKSDRDIQQDRVKTIASVDDLLNESG